MGKGFTYTAVEWREQNTVITKGEEMCQEILVLIDVGAWPELEDTLPHRPGPALPWSLFPAALPI